MVLSFLFGKVWPRLNGKFFRQNQDNIGVHETGARSCNQASLAKLKDRYVINCDSQKQNISSRFWPDSVIRNMAEYITYLAT
jgi:hypothetical protein